MSNYTQITLQEMDEALSRDLGWVRDVIPLGNSREWVYSFSHERLQDVVIKVWSSIQIGNGQARRSGADAIRVCAVRHERGYIRSRRVNRVTGWRNNLRLRIREVMASVRHRFDVEQAPVERPVTLTDRQREAREFLNGYRGTFQFLLDMKRRLMNNWAMSDGQWAAVNRCLTRERDYQERRAARTSKLQNAREEALIPDAAPFGRGGELQEVEVDGDPWL